MKFKVFRQIADSTFVEIAQTIFMEDADAVLNNWHSGMVATIDGAIVTTKNLTTTEEPTLFSV